MDILGWTPRQLERLAVGSMVIGAALLAGPAVVWAFGPGPLLPHRPVAAVVTLTTAGWAWWLATRLMRSGRMGSVLWLGPLCGALNAGTALALLSTDRGLVSTLHGMLVGSLVGAPVGGALGLAFGGVMAAALAYAHRLRDKEPSDAGLRLVAAMAAWWLAVVLAGHAMATHLAQLTADTPWASVPKEVEWAVTAAKVIATGMALAALVLHGWALRWARAVRRGAHPELAVRPTSVLPPLALPPLPSGPAAEVLVRRASAGRGAFRRSETQAAVGYLASVDELRFRAALAAALVAVTGLLWRL